MSVNWQTVNPPRTIKPRQGKHRLLRRIATEPFVHFALISVAIFGWFKLAQPVEWNVAPDARVIIIDQQQVDVLAKQFEDTWRRPPNTDELGKLKED